MKTVFILISTGFVSRYILRTDIIHVLKNAGFRIVLLTPNPNEEYFRKEFECENVIIEKYEIEKYQKYIQASKLQQWLKLARSFVLKREDDLVSINTRLKITLDQSRGFFKKLGLKTMIALLRKSAFLRKLTLFFETKFFTPDFHNELFRKYAPSLLITASLGNLWLDQFIMREARRAGVRLLSMVLSWDNTSTKGMEGVEIDHVIVWTKKMKEEVIENFDISADQVVIGGIANFDVYRQRDKIWSRDQVCEKFGLDPARKVILFGTRSPTSYPYNADVLDILADAINSNRFSQPCQVLVRLHPIHFKAKDGPSKIDEEMKKYRLLQQKCKHIYLDVPEILSDKLAIDMPYSEVIKLASLLYASDILVTVFSTLMIEAALCDVPIVNAVMFTHHKHLTIDDRISTQYAHVDRIIKTGGVKTSFTAKEFVEHIDAYLKDASLDHAGRSMIVANECTRIGQAGQYIGQVIVDLVHGTPVDKASAQGKDESGLRRTG